MLLAVTSVQQKLFVGGIVCFAELPLSIPCVMMAEQILNHYLINYHHELWLFQKNGIEMLLLPGRDCQIIFLT